MSFFFSSRRRHTRFDCDWIRRVLFRSITALQVQEYLFMPFVEVHATTFLNLQRGDWLVRPSCVGQIGRASCRERALIPVVAGEVDTRCAVEVAENYVVYAEHLTVNRVV